MFGRLDGRSRLVFDIAQTEARALGHNYVGTEHVLLALAVADSPAADLLSERDCGPETIRADIAELIGRGRVPQCEPDELLASLGIDLTEVRRRVEATFGADAISRAALRTRPRRRRLPVLQRWWPGCEEGSGLTSPLLGRRWYGLAPRLKQVLELATRGAEPTPASPLHLLIGILDEGDGVGCQILARRGVDLNGLRAAARRSLVRRGESS